MDPARQVRTLVLGLVMCGCADKPGRPAASASESQPVEDTTAVTSIDESERIIEASGGDCAQSCSALAKMTTARVKLCSPRTSACPDAERREEDARRTVTSYCGKCP